MSFDQNILVSIGAKDQTIIKWLILEKPSNRKPNDFNKELEDAIGIIKT